MSGPVTELDTPRGGEGSGQPRSPRMEISKGRRATVGDVPVQRILPRRIRRTVGAWCFADHMGPADLEARSGPGVGPHPHIGLQTVTWLLQGKVLHRDSLGSDQVIVPGELNLMTAGRGIAHAEQGTGRYVGPLEGLQLWVALPDADRNGRPGFEHHGDLPAVEIGGAVCTVLIGELGGAESPARRYGDLVGADLTLPAGQARLPLRSDFEYALIMLRGDVDVDGTEVQPGSLAYLGEGRTSLEMTATTGGRTMLLGGTPLSATPFMWWNFVARSPTEVEEAHRDWMERTDRFGPVLSDLERVDAPRPSWLPPAT